MPKLPLLKPREIVSILGHLGFVEIRQRAAHKQLRHPDGRHDGGCGTGACTISSVASNEPIDGLGDGDESPDWQIVDAHHVNLRAERSGTGSGRIYTITITCTDGGGHTSTKNVQVTVAH